MTGFGLDFDSGLVINELLIGFIWEVKLYNYAISMSEYLTEISGPDHPLSSAFPLSPCSFSEYQSGTGACFACNAVCTNGCVSADNCNLCDDNLCTVCTTFDIGYCVTCTTDARLNNGVCSCDPGTFNLHGVCTPCHVTCMECVGGSSMQCSSCLVRAILATAPTGYCVCSPGFFPSPNTSNCKECHSACSTCSGPSSSQCISCHANAVRNSASECVCLDGYFSIPGTGECGKCDKSCYSCVDSAATSCYSCRENARLVSGLCTCASGYWPSSSVTAAFYCQTQCLTCAGSGATVNFVIPSIDILTTKEACVSQPRSFSAEIQVCVKCSIGCKQCISGSQCIECEPGWFLGSSQQCSTHCEVPNINHCEVNYNPDRCFSASLRRGDAGVDLIFSANLSDHLSPSVISLAFFTTNNTIAQPVWGLVEIVSYWRYEIEFNTTETITAVLTFRSPSLINSDSCYGLATSTLSFQVNPNQAISAEPTLQKKPQLIANLPDYAMGLITFAASYTMINSNRIFWTVLLQAQFVSYIAMSQLDMPDSLRVILISSNPINLLFDPFSYNQITHNDGLPVHIENGGFSSYSTFDNIGELTGPYITLFTMMLVYKLCQCSHIDCLVRLVRKKITKKLTTNLPMLILESYLTMCTACCIQLYECIYVGFPVSTAYDTAAMIFTIPLGMLLVFVAIFSYSTTLREIGRGHNTEHPLFAEYCSLNSTSARCFYVWFCVRRLTFSAIQVFLSTYPVLQLILHLAIFISVVTIQFAIYLNLSMQFKTKLTRIASISVEIGTALIFILGYCYLISMTDASKDKLKNAILAVTLIVSLLPLADTAHKAVGKLRKMAKKKYKVMNAVSVSVFPLEHTSMAL